MEVLQESRAKVEEWTTHQKKAMEALRSEEESAIVALRNECLKLQETLKASGERGRILQETLAKEKAEIDALKDEISRAEQTVTTTNEDVERLRQNVEKRKLELEKKRKEITIQANDRDQKASLLRGYERVFTSALGIKLENSDNGLRISFNCIDRKSPERIFVIDLAVIATNPPNSGTSTSYYSITYCSPQLPQNESIEIISLLNKNGDLCSFLSSVRQSFIKLTNQ